MEHCDVKALFEISSEDCSNYSELGYLFMEQLSYGL